jgi:hypothetical protein
MQMHSQRLVTVVLSILIRGPWSPTSLRFNFPVKSRSSLRLISILLPVCGAHFAEPNSRRVDLLVEPRSSILFASICWRSSGVLELTLLHFASILSLTALRNTL